MWISCICGRAASASESAILPPQKNPSIIPLVVVHSANAYCIEVVSETVGNLLKQSLKYHPHHVPWIRLRGDFEYRNDNYEVAMACYVSAIMIGSEYCTMNLQRQIDDYIIRRMIKCSTNLGCCMQAAILCQFLEDIDYNLAFKTFTERSTFKTVAEKSNNFSDAMDSYFNCIWDPTLLEFIVNLQSRKGEHKRKLQAVGAIFCFFVWVGIEI